MASPSALVGVINQLCELVACKASHCCQWLRCTTDRSQLRSIPPTCNTTPTPIVFVVCRYGYIVPQSNLLFCELYRVAIFCHAKFSYTTYAWLKIKNRELYSIAIHYAAWIGSHMYSSKAIHKIMSFKTVCCYTIVNMKVLKARNFRVIIWWLMLHLRASILSVSSNDCHNRMSSYD